MAKQAQTAKKALGTTGKAKAARAPKEPKPEAALVTVNDKALSIEVGPVVIASLAKTYEDEQKATSMLQAVQGKRYDLLSNTTLAIAKAFSADESIDPAAAFTQDRKEAQKLNDQLLIALGVREYVDVKGKQKLVYTKAVSRYFPGPKDAKDDPKTVQKSTLRSNFIHLVKKCAQAAVTIHEKGVTAAYDEEAKTLRISGPTVQKAFGASEVLLNEKQRIETSNGKDPLQLEQRPSFQALANLSAADHGAVVKSGNNDRTKKQILDPQEAMEELATTVVNAISKLKTVTPRIKVSLERMFSAIDKKLDMKAAA